MHTLHKRKKIKFFYETYRELHHKLLEKDAVSVLCYVQRNQILNRNLAFLKFTVHNYKFFLGTRLKALILCKEGILEL